MKGPFKVGLLIRGTFNIEILHLLSFHDKNKVVTLGDVIDQIENIKKILLSV